MSLVQSFKKCDFKCTVLEKRALELFEFMIPFNLMVFHCLKALFKDYLS